MIGVLFRSLCVSTWNLFSFLQSLRIDWSCFLKRPYCLFENWIKNSFKSLQPLLRMIYSRISISASSRTIWTFLDQWYVKFNKPSSLSDHLLNLEGRDFSLRLSISGATTFCFLIRSFFDQRETKVISHFTFVAVDPTLSILTMLIHHTRHFTKNYYLFQVVCAI